MRDSGCLRILVSASVLLALVGCGSGQSPQKAQAQRSALRTAPSCADAAVVARLRQMVIQQAGRLKPSAAIEIQKVAEDSEFMIVGVTRANRDPALDLTICRAQLIFELPVGRSDAFDGGRQIAAPLRYAVQRTAGGDLAVHQLEGAEPLAYRLAAVPSLTSPPAQSAAPKSLSVPEIRSVQRRSTREVMRPAAPLPPRSGLPEPALTSRGRPSFDCRRAASRVQRMICRDERLAALDRVTTSLYARRLSRADRATRLVLQQSQARFVERRDDCRRAGCVADRYRDRLDEIDAIATR